MSPYQPQRRPYSGPAPQETTIHIPGTLPVPQRRTGGLIALAVLVIGGGLITVAVLALMVALVLGAVAVLATTALLMAIIRR